jgi:ornithine cyclodeaminase
VAAGRPALVERTTPLRLVVFGAGPQGLGHVRTLSSVLDGVRDVTSVTHVVRRPPAYVDRVAAGARVVAAGSEDAHVATAAADVVVCATTSREPLFDSGLVRHDAIVIAVGSHEPEVREVDSALVGGAQVVVEDVATARRECGDIVLAIEEGAVRPDRLVSLRDVVAGAVPLATDRPILFKGSGMAWQDLVIADAIVGQPPLLG